MDEMGISDIESKRFVNAVVIYSEMGSSLQQRLCDSGANFHTT